VVFAENPSGCVLRSGMRAPDDLQDEIALPF
jgi:hypothetical protein